jgi:hypothetical protein
MSSSSHVDLEKAPPPPSSPRHPSDDHGTPLSTLKIPHSEPQQQLDDPTGQGEDPFESKLREFIFIATVCSGQLITQVCPTSPPSSSESRGRFSVRRSLSAVSFALSFSQHATAIYAFDLFSHNRLR